MAVLEPEQVRERVRDQVQNLKPELRLVAAAEPVVIGAMVLGQIVRPAPAVEVIAIVPAATVVGLIARRALVLVDKPAVTELA